MSKPAKAEQNRQPVKRLTGKALLAKVKELKSLDKSAKAKACGYVSRSQSGTERAQLTKFMNALLVAQSIDINEAEKSKRGPKLRYRIAVQRNGALCVNAAYTHQMGWQQGDQIELKLGRKYIKLQRIEESP